MSHKLQPPSFNVPGKVFLLGEYAVLAGLPAVVAAVGPRFELRATEGSGGTPIAPESPAGKLIHWARAQGLPEMKFEFTDPHRGAGGFGASTAQFALAYQAYAQIVDWDRRWERVWKLYRELTAGPEFPPSGADLVAQWKGGMTFFDSSEKNAPHSMDVWPIFDWTSLLVFSATGQAGRKVATHEHLDRLKRGSWAHTLEGPLSRGISAIQEGNARALGQAMTDYADALFRADLELPASRDDRAVLRNLPGVLGVKGAGAMQADAMLVLMEPRSPHREQVIQEATARGLALVANGLPHELGVSSCL